MVAHDPRSIADWLIAGAPSAPTLDDALAQTCEQLVGCGVPLWRVALFVRTLHPELIGRRLLWKHGEAVAISDAPLHFVETPGFLESPVARVISTGAELRRRLDDRDRLEFPVLRELAAEGVADYLASPLPSPTARRTS
jgi:adenylate cyclase